MMLTEQEGARFACSHQFLTMRRYCGRHGYGSPVYTCDLVASLKTASFLQSGGGG